MVNSTANWKSNENMILINTHPCVVNFVFKALDPISKISRIYSNKNKSKYIRIMIRLRLCWVILHSLKQHILIWSMSCQTAYTDMINVMSDSIYSYDQCHVRQHILIWWTSMSCQTAYTHTMNVNVMSDSIYSYDQCHVRQHILIWSMSCQTAYTHMINVNVMSVNFSSR